ncbi:MAG: peroxiredoxin [Omnitrophica bacterium RIFCSPLOWO2_12_FULL_50_11]|nr:MAG: peroxiredoxin [Omnitrophica bacterium RIFCSPLOWO2_12_FULL_50_11]
MALVESIRIALGTKMPDFELKDAHGKPFNGKELFGAKGLLVAFTCNHCPYAQAVWPRLIELGRYAKSLGVNTVGINPNIHPDYPEDAPPRMIQKEKELGINFPYLVDETQDVAREFQAQCTPDLYLFNSARELVYHGRLDDNWKEPKKVKREELKDAIDRLVAGEAVSEKQYPSMGCSIKWRE